MDSKDSMTAEKPTAGIPIDLGDGKTWELRFTLGATKRLSKKFGSSLMNLGLGRLDESQLSDMILEGLQPPSDQPAQAKPTMQWLDNNLDIRKAPYLIETVVKAWFRNQAKNEPPLTAADLTVLRTLLAGMTEYASRTTEAIDLMLLAIEAKPTTTAEQ